MWQRHFREEHVMHASYIYIYPEPSRLFAFNFDLRLLPHNTGHRQACLLPFMSSLEKHSMLTQSRDELEDDENLLSETPPTNCETFVQKIDDLYGPLPQVSASKMFTNLIVI